MKMNLTTSEKNRGIVRFLLMSMLLCLLIHPAQAQDRVTVTGRLTDTSHAPLIGASVIEQGTTNGVTTDTEGNYQISVSGNATLGFSFIGYKPQSIAVLNRTVIDVTLEEDATMIGEVVAIGYGSQRKEDLSMAVTTVKLDEAAKSRASNLATILQGRMPGVTVQQTGDPMKPASFTIRGRGSKGNDDDPTSGDGVLVVVDGVPNAPYMMEDVETITVLKDAASAAIYGASVGSSGVILITTKKAQSGKLRVDVNVSLGFEKVTNLPKMLTAEQYNEVWAKTVEKNPGSQLPSASNPEVYPWGNVTRTDWLDEIFQTGFTQHYAATISGGSEKVQSIFSVSYDKKDGVLLNTYSESFNGKLQTHQLAQDFGACVVRGIQRAGQRGHQPPGPDHGCHMVPARGFGLRDERGRDIRPRREGQPLLRRYEPRVGGRERHADALQPGSIPRKDAPQIPRA